MGTNLLLGKLDLVQESLVLFVGFDGERLVAILRDFLLLVLNSAFVLAPGRFVGLSPQPWLFPEALWYQPAVLQWRPPA